MAEPFPAAALAAAACPHCPDPDQPLTALPGVLGCAAGHRFDIAREGYVALLGARARTDTADSAAMMAARSAFLGRGHYAPIADAVRIASAEDGPLLEIGAGTGYYLGVALGDRTGIALDSSKYAARRAAADPRVMSVVADAWSRLPLRTAAVGGVLSVFAPRDPAEIRRVLTPGGVLVAVTPEPDHLAEIRAATGMLTVDPGKADALAAQFTDLIPDSRVSVRYSITLADRDLADVVAMGPAARHRDAGQIHRAAADVGTATATVAVTVSSFRQPG